MTIAQPEGTGPIETDPRIVETHISTLFFVGDRVYKLKKPVQMAFLDWSTPERRHEACLLEVALNSRVAPDVYLGVADIIDAEGQRCDSLVVMRRLPSSRSLSRLVVDGVDVTESLGSLARQLAAFHAGCRHGPEVAETGRPNAVLANWRDNCAQMATHATRGLVDPDVVEAVARLSESYVRGRGQLFEHRVEAGRVRDGHGDLLAEDIFVLDDGIRVLDCLEFDPRLRYGDVLADVAFLAMDLERLGAGVPAASFLSWYREFSGDNWPATLAHHWIAYRALVRAKVACLRHDQGDPTAAAQAATLLGLCHRHLRHAAVRLVLVGGLPGTGKTTTASGLAERLGWALFSSDELRHQMSGLPAGPQGYRKGLYRPEMTRAVYRGLLDRASRCLAFGESVILDASWTDSRWRLQAAVAAARHEATLVEIVCVAPPEVAERRIQNRSHDREGMSDATPAVARQMATDADTWPTAHQLDCTVGLQGALCSALTFASPDYTDDLFRSGPV
jgi:aminoglycoside phosphotransferase family enzyme/predicted kinase